jgi:tRNA nucleotidyltransferase/poly(A) polymerase
MLPTRLKNIIENLQSEDWVVSLLKRGKLFLVGGSVRDAYRDKEVKDIDLIVQDLSMEDIKSILIDFGRVDIVGESFAVIKFRPIGHTGEDYDIAIPRIDTKTGEGHKGFSVETEGVGILDDLKRRDFTINSIAIDVKTGNILDPFDGLIDIRWKKLRATDKNAFIEDPLRILRGIQFAARFGYEIDLSTMELMRENSHLIKDISGERIMGELMKIIAKKGNTQIALNLIHQTDVDKALFDKKMLKYDSGFESLDVVSFFYVLGLLGDTNSADFVKKRLKGEFRLEKDVRNLDKMFSNLSRIHEEEDLKFMVSKLFSESPSLMDVVINPEEVEDIILQMRMEKIPKSMRSIMINGDDVITISQGKFKGEKVGQILDRILGDALMNRFNWKDRRDSMEYLAQIIYDGQ